MQVVFDYKENVLNCEMDHISKEMYYLGVDKTGSEEEKGTTTSEYGLPTNILNSGHPKASRMKPVSDKRMHTKSHKHMAQGKVQRPRISPSTYQRPLTPRINPANPFKFEISTYDLQVSEQNIETVKTLYSNVHVEPDAILKLQSLTSMSQYYQYMQQQNFNEFYEQKRQHDIDQWLASCSEEDKKLYLDRMNATVSNNSSKSQQLSQQSS